MRTFEFKGKIYENIGPYKNGAFGHRDVVRYVALVRSKNAVAFIKANEESPVVSGYAIPDGGGGGYTLADGRHFKLSLTEMRSIPTPRWDFPDEV